MAVDTRHPDYTDRAEEWREMRATSRGAKAVKEDGEEFLPMPSGFRAQTDGGNRMYAAYQKRAQFPEIVGPTIRGMIGVIHRTEAQIDMPDAMQGLWERATADGLALEAFHRRITSELLLTGRYSILADAKSEGSELPYLAGYSAEALINWSPDRDFYVLDESGLVRFDFEWRQEKRYRVLQLVEGRYEVERYTGTEKDGDTLQPAAQGNRALVQKDTFISKLLVDDGLTKALIEAGVGKEYLKAAKAMLKDSVKILHEDGTYRAVVETDMGEDDVGKFVQNWSQSDEGKVFISKPTGGDAKGGDGQRFGDNPFDTKGGTVKPNLTKAQELIASNPEKARQMAKAVGHAVTW
ncbi:hypothetical protein [Aureimonas sp. ME7]|uniref:hypothetical protein n=1 Tax=Aureimonas sp. ME7 TaxID=2744252 RepID=UPI0015F439D0|nr:hypothetical protein [Aureimonas sp. ME7]